MKRNLLCLNIAILMLSACVEQPKTEAVAAQVGESQLLLSDILEVMPSFSVPEDSASFVSEYVQKWVDEELVYQQGMRYLPDYGQLLQQVEDYRRQLVSQSYERELLQQHVQDLSDAECESFYEQYGKQLLLDEPVIKGFFVKVPTDKKTKNRNLRDWLQKLQKGNTDQVEAMEQYLQIHAVDYDGFLDQWKPLSFVSDRLPEQVVDPVSFLKLKILELTDDEFTYFLLLTDFRLAGEQMPYECALPQIREILLNQHSKEFLEQSHREIREHALETGNLKIYITE